MTRERRRQETNPETEVAAAAAKLVAAFAAHDRDAYFECFAPDATFVFYTTPMLLASRDAYRELWDRWEHDHGFQVLSCESRDQHVTVMQNAAIFTHRVATAARFDGTTAKTDERETIIFERRDGRWLAVHEHLSPMPEGEHP